MLIITFVLVGFISIITQIIYFNFENNKDKFEFFQSSIHIYDQQTDPKLIKYRRMLMRMRYIQAILLLLLFLATVAL